MKKIKLNLENNILSIDILSQDKNKIYSQVINNFNVIDLTNFLDNDNELIINNNFIEHTLKFEKDIFILSRVKYINENYGKGSIVKFKLTTEELIKFKRKFKYLILT